MHYLFKIPPQKRRKDSFKSNQIGPQNANKRLMGKWDKCPIYYSINYFFFTYLAGGCVLFHGFTPTKVGSHKSYKLYFCSFLEQGKSAPTLVPGFRVVLKIWQWLFTGFQTRYYRVSIYWAYMPIFGIYSAIPMHVFGYSHFAKPLFLPLTWHFLETHIRPLFLIGAIAHLKSGLDFALAIRNA